jgi:hypothetical protein
VKIVEIRKGDRNQKADSKENRKRTKGERIQEEQKKEKKEIKI